MPTVELASLQAQLGTLGAVNPDAGGFTLVTITGSFSQLEADGPSSSTGQFTFTLTGPMSNGGVTIPTVPLTVPLDDNGQLRVILPANQDTATTPQGLCYGVTEIVANQPRDYFITVPATSSTVDISDLMPGVIAWN